MGSTASQTVPTSESVCVTRARGTPASRRARRRSAPAGVASASGRALPALEVAFRTGDGVAWSELDPEMSEVQARFSRPLHRSLLVDVWLAAVPGLVDRLDAGARVADVGCGFAVPDAQPSSAA